MSIIHGYMFDNTIYKKENSDELFKYKYLILEVTPNMVDIQPFLKEIMFSMGKRIFDYLDDEFLVIVTIKHLLLQVEINVITNNNELIVGFDEMKIPIKNEIDKNPDYTVVGYNADLDCLGSIESKDLEFKINNLTCYF